MFVNLLPTLGWLITDFNLSSTSKKLLALAAIFIMKNE